MIEKQELSKRKKMVELALDQYGIQEWSGSKHNPEVLKYFDEIGHSWVDDDETAWCSAFVNWVAMKAGYEYSGKLNARSWLDIGDIIGRRIGTYIEVKVNDTIVTPILGDVVILWRVKKDSPWGHVGFYIREDENYVWVLGGNQSNKVCISKYPKSRVLGYRRLNKVNNIINEI